MVVNNTNNVGHTNGIRAPYSVLDGSRKATNFLRKVAGSQIPPEFAQHLQDVTLTTATDGTQIYFPCPFKETEATVALKSVEAAAVAALARVRFPDDASNRKIEVDLERTATFLFSTYIATIAGMGKQDPDVKSKLKSKFFTSPLLYQITHSDNAKIPIYSRHKRFYIGDCLQICMRPRTLASITISMDHWRLARP